VGAMVVPLSRDRLSTRDPHLGKARVHSLWLSKLSVKLSRHKQSFDFKLENIGRVTKKADLWRYPIVHTVLQC